MAIAMALKMQFINLIKMKNVNFVFSLLFLSWCILHFHQSGKEGTHFHKTFGYGFKEIELNVFWSLVIILTSFNFIAFFTGRFICYLFGAAGLIVICCAQLIFVLIFVTILFSDSSNKEIFDYFNDRIALILLTFPYILFGILSSLYCYQQDLNEKTDENRTKFQALFLKFCFTDYKKINLFFHLSISFCMFGFFLMIFKINSRFEYAMLYFLAPIIPTFFTCLAYFLNAKKSYCGTMLFWAILGIVFIFVIPNAMRHTLKYRPEQIPSIISISIICVINTFVGFFSTLAVYYDNKPKNENGFENPVHVSYIVTEENIAL